MKGIILGVGGDRLHPITVAVAKHVLPVGGKPMIYYPLSVLMLMGIREVMVVATPAEIAQLRRLLGDGQRLGMRVFYGTRAEPDGTAAAFTVAAGHVGSDTVALVFGDNIFHGHGFSGVLAECAGHTDGCVLFSQSTGPGRGTDLTITGLAVYDNDVLGIARDVLASRAAAGVEDVNHVYLACGKARLVELGRGFTWLDADTPEALLQASRYVHTLENRLGVRIACVEEVALRMGFIDRHTCHRLGAELSGSEYGRYIMELSGELRMSGAAR